MNIPVLLATASQEKAVWLCFGFYLLNVLVPIIPATVIYHLFPEGKTNARAKRLTKATRGTLSKAVSVAGRSKLSGRGALTSRLLSWVTGQLTPPPFHSSEL